MLQWSPYIYIRWVFWLIVGIVIEANWGIYAQWVDYSLLGSWAIFGVLLLFFYQKIKKNAPIILGILATFTLVFFGIFRTHHYQEFYQKNHLYHLKDSVIAYTACIDEEVQNRKFSFRTEAEIKEVRTKKGWQKVKGRLMISFKKDEKNISTLQKLKYGDVILVRGSPFLVIPPENPEEFDYKKFLTYQNIYHHHYVVGNTHQIIDYKPKNLFVAYSLHLRIGCSQLLNQLVNSQRESAIAVALVLGVKEQMDNEILQAYSNTGLMHVLAVSGMHVGMMLIPLAWLLGWLEKKGLKGKIIYASIILTFLWSYAIITGFSASVLRAVVMFSLVALGNIFGKKGTMYNILACSAFFLLVYEPFLLWSVGFQLSYLAVLSIVIFQPIIKNWYEPKNKFVGYFWELTSVSLSAQLLTFPLGFYYFHQFPNYFLFANLLIIPISSIILYLGVLCIILGWLPFINVFLGLCLWFGIWAMNYITLLLEKLPYSLTENVYWTLGQTFLMYAFIFSIFLFFIKKKLIYYHYATYSLVLFMGIFVFRFFEQQAQHFFVIYHTPKQATCAVVQSNKMVVLQNDTANPQIRDFAIKPALASWGVDKKNQKNVFWKDEQFLTKNFIYKKENGFSFLLFYKNQNFNKNPIKILILDKKIPKKQLTNVLTQFENLEVDYVWVQYNTLTEIATLHQIMGINALIIDASNTKKRASELENQAKKLKIRCYNIWEKGFFRL